VVLEALQGDRARLSIAGVSVTHSFMDVADMWFGDFIMLWRPPNGNALPLGRGSRGDNVVWLRESLAAIDDRYRAEPLDSVTYDANWSNVSSSSSATIGSSSTVSRVSKHRSSSTRCSGRPTRPG
jgi:hypothetical protein